MSGPSRKSTSLVKASPTLNKVILATVNLDNPTTREFPRATSLQLCSKSE
ncbi:hypothetical protein LINPERPRIM_LOCUS23832 [Linum perenne]